MKKGLVCIVALVMSFAAHARLTPDCRESLDEAIELRKDIYVLIDEGKVSEGEGSILLAMNDNLAEVKALTCSGLKRLQLERSLSGRLGLISEERATQKAQRVFDEAISYFQNAIK